MPHKLAVFLLKLKIYNNMIANQLSTQYKGIGLGFSKTYFLNDSGCLCACLDKISGNNNLINTNEKLKAGGCFYNECLLDLTKVPTAFSQLTYKGKFAYDNTLALKTIKEQGIVIAEVDYNPIMNGTQQHFVCMVGDGKIEDPLGGKIKPVSTYKTYLTLRVFEIKPMVTVTNVSINQEEENILKFLKENNANEGRVREAFGALSAVTEKDKQILILTNKVSDLEVKVTEITATLENLRLNFIEKEKNEARQQKVLATANTTIDDQKLKMEELDRLAKDNRNQYLKKNDEFNAYKESEKISLIETMSVKQLFNLIIKKLTKK